jgi:hypothetical protein
LLHGSPLRELRGWGEQFIRGRALAVAPKRSLSIIQAEFLQSIAQAAEAHAQALRRFRAVPALGFERLRQYGALDVLEVAVEVAATRVEKRAARGGLCPAGRGRGALDAAELQVLRA